MFLLFSFQLLEIRCALRNVRILLCGTWMYLVLWNFCNVHFRASSPSCPTVASALCADPTGLAGICKSLPQCAPLICFVCFNHSIQFLKSKSTNEPKYWSCNILSSSVTWYQTYFLFRTSSLSLLSSVHSAVSQHHLPPRWRAGKRSPPQMYGTERVLTCENTCFHTMLSHVSTA